MKTVGGVRCDICSKMADKVDEEKFLEFMMPRHGRFPGISRGGNKGEPVALHACPSCTPKVRHMMTFKVIDHLPDGPLKIALDRIKWEGNLFKPEREIIRPRYLN